MTVPMRLRPRSLNGDQGAAAVELALVMPLFFLLLMGIINYGLWFNDSIELRHGVRESARQAVVLRTFSGAACTGATGMDNVACGTKSEILTTGGASYVKISTPDGWVRGNQVVVCAMVEAINFTGFVPLPAGGLIKAKTTMSIEKITPVPSPIFHTDTPPAGGDWTWCTA